MFFGGAEVTATSGGRGSVVASIVQASRVGKSMVLIRRTSGGELVFVALRSLSHANQDIHVGANETAPENAQAPGLNATIVAEVTDGAAAPEITQVAHGNSKH